MTCTLTDMRRHFKLKSVLEYTLIIQTNLITDHEHSPSSSDSRLGSMTHISSISDALMPLDKHLWTATNSEVELWVCETPLGLGAGILKTGLALTEEVSPPVSFEEEPEDLHLSRLFLNQAWKGMKLKISMIKNVKQLWEIWRRHHHHHHIWSPK